MKKDYEFRIYGAATSGVETTVASSNLRNAPTVKGPTIDAVRGRSQSRPWDVEINDDGDFFSSIISDSDGRMALNGRLCDLRLNKDGAGFSVIGTGRIGDIIDHVSHYTVSVQDERLRERTATIFTKQNVAPGSGSSSQYTGSNIFPAGLAAEYGQFVPRVPPSKPGYVAATTDSLAFVFFDIVDGVWNDRLWDLVLDDVKSAAIVNSLSTIGNFNHLRANVDGSDLEIASFDTNTEGIEDGDLTIETVPTFTATLTGSNPFPGCWVVNPGALSTGDAVKVYLHMPTAEPDELLPLHIGGQDGIEPFQVLKDLYDEHGVRYSTSAMQSMIDDTEFGRAWWRITEPQPLSKWVEDNIYGPYGVAPLTNASGEVTPTKVRLPQDITVASLFEFNKTNLAREPEWHYSASDRVTALRYEYTVEESINIFNSGESDWPADLIRISKRAIERTHDRLDSGQAPRREVTFSIEGFHQPTVIRAGATPLGSQVFKLDRFIDSAAREVFERFGDGPIRGTCIGLSSAESVNAGDYATINLETFPAPSTQGRGAVRIVQILSRVDAPDGPEFEWLDIGPSLNSLTAPTITVAAATSDPKHSVIATVSGSSSTSIGYQLQWGTGTTEPGSTSWKDWAGQGDSTGTNTITPLPSGNIIWLRGRATDQNRIRSAWSTAPNTTTEALQPPTGLASSSIDGTSVLLDWTLGTSDSPKYPVEVLATTGACPSTERVSMSQLHAGSLKYKAEGLTQDTTHCFGVRHYDIYGGVSAEDTLSVQATTSPPTSPSLIGIGLELIVGSTS